MIVGEQPERTRDTRPVDRIEHRLLPGMTEARVREYLQANPEAVLTSKQIACRIHTNPRSTAHVLELMHAEGFVTRRLRARGLKAYLFSLAKQ